MSKDGPKLPRAGLKAFDNDILVSVALDVEGKHDIWWKSAALESLLEKEAFGDMPDKLLTQTIEHFEGYNTKVTDRWISSARKELNHRKGST